MGTSLTQAEVKNNTDHLFQSIQIDVHYGGYCSVDTTIALNRVPTSHEDVINAIVEKYLQYKGIDTKLTLADIIHEKFPDQLI